MSQLSPHVEMVLERAGRLLADEVRDAARARFGAQTPAETAAPAADGTVVPLRSRSRSRRS